MSRVRQLLIIIEGRIVLSTAVVVVYIYMIVPSRPGQQGVQTGYLKKNLKEDQTPEFTCRNNLEKEKVGG